MGCMGPGWSQETEVLGRLFHVSVSLFFFGTETHAHEVSEREVAAVKRRPNVMSHVHAGNRVKLAVVSLP